MDIYEIADLKIKMKSQCNILKNHALKYRSDVTDIDFEINMPNSFLIQKQLENPNLTADECEYIWAGIDFYTKLIDYDGFMLHASAVVVDNKAYLFSASSGTGKSTHTLLWQKYFGEDKAIIINDDKPAIRRIDGKFYAYGTPWSGKENKNVNIKVPLQGICVIERNQDNFISRLNGGISIYSLLNQTIRPKNRDSMDKLLNIMIDLLKQIPVYKLCCNMNIEAVSVAYEAMK